MSSNQESDIKDIKADINQLKIAIEKINSALDIKSNMKRKFDNTISQSSTSATKIYVNGALEETTFDLSSKEAAGRHEEDNVNHTGISIPLLFFQLIL